MTMEEVLLNAADITHVQLLSKTWNICAEVKYQKFVETVCTLSCDVLTALLLKIQPSGMPFCVTGCLFLMLLRIVSSSSCTPWQWLPRHRDPLQDRQLHVQWHCVMSQNWIISVLHLYCLLCALTIEALCSSKSCYCNHLPTYGSHVPEVRSVCVFTAV